LPFLSGLLIVQAFIVGAYSIEKILCQRQYIGEYVGLALHFINTNSALGVVILIVWYLIEHPIVGAILIMQATITWLKLISYVHANYDHRLTMMSSSSSTENNNKNNIGTGPNNMQQLALVKDLDPCDTKLVYPNNVTLSDIYYFWFAPTLTYQLAYPRSPYIRWMKVLTLFGQLIICVLLVIFIAAQVIAPTLDLLVHDLETSRGELRTQTIGDYLLKLSISSTYIWLLVFYGFFHCFLNLTAEILRFGDRGESFFCCEEGMGCLFPCLKLLSCATLTNCHTDLYFTVCLFCCYQMKCFTEIGGMPLRLVPTGDYGICLCTTGLSVTYTFHQSERACPKRVLHSSYSSSRPSYTRY
jgi:diacylglycerol O-acyltransferase-1